MAGTIARLNIPTEQHYCAAVVAFVVEAARLAGFDKQAIYEVELAVEETYTNIVKHGFGNDPFSAFEIHCEQTPLSFQITFYAKGVPFDPTRIPEYHPETSGIDGSLAGLGTHLVRRVMDQVLFENRGREGYAIRLVKNCPQPPTDLHPAETAEPPAKTRPAPASPSKAAIPHTIRPLLPEDAIEVSKGAFEVYGYSYEDFVYQPDQLIELNRRGLMRSFVAVAENHEIIGHCALKWHCPDEQIAEKGVFFVRPKFRGGGYAQELNTAVINEARAAGLVGLYGRAVAGHVVSQKVNQSFGFRTCGILIGALPPQIDFKGLTGLIPEKMSGVLIWLQLADARRRTVYIPAGLAAPIENIYRTLELPIDIAEPPAKPEDTQQPQSDIRLEVSKIMNIATIEVLRVGSDLLTRIRTECRRLFVAQVSAIYLHLNIEHPATPAIVSALKEREFFFSGILPSSMNGRDALILQRLNSLQIDYSRIQLLTDSDRELLSFIQSQDPICRDLGG